MPSFWRNFGAVQIFATCIFIAFYFIFPLSFYIKKNYIFASELNITVMAPKKTVTKKKPVKVQMPIKKFKYIKGCKELVDDPFNLK